MSSSPTCGFPAISTDSLRSKLPWDGQGKPTFPIKPTSRLPSLNLSTINGDSMEIGPLPVVGPANVILNVAGPEHYRGWQMVSLYFPPTT